MVLSFAPRSNVSDPCEGVDEYNVGRPPRNLHVIHANIVMFTTLQVLEVINLTWHWLWRNKTRFYKIRRIEWSFLLMLNFTLAQVAGELSYTMPLPCMVLILFYVISLGSFGMLVCLRALTVLAESHYANLTKRRSEVFKNDILVLTLPYRRCSIVLLTSICFTCTRVASLRINETLMLKKSIFTVALILLFPAIVVAVVLIVGSPHSNPVPTVSPF